MLLNLTVAPKTLLTVSIYYYIYCRLANYENLVPNNGYLDWFLDNKIRGSWVYYQLRVTSMNDPTNNDLSEVFVISKPIQLDISVHRRNALNALRGVRMTLHGMTGEQQGVTLTKDDLHEVVRVNNIGEILSVTLEVTDGSRTNGSNMVDSFVEIHSLTGIEQDVVTGFASQLAVQERFDCYNFESDCDSCTRVDGKFWLIRLQHFCLFFE